MKTIFAAILAISVSSSAFSAQGAQAQGAPERNVSAQSAPNNQDQLIDKVLSVSGMKKSLQDLPAQIAAGFMQTASRSGADPDSEKELTNALAQAFPRDIFVNRVSAALKKNYDQARYANYVQVLSTPLARRMLALEVQEPNPAEVRAFFAQVAKSPLPAERIKLIQRMDAAAQGSALLNLMTISSLEAGALAAGGDCSAAVDRIEEMIKRSRPEIEKANRSRVQVMLAYTYRDVPDADLGAYVETYEGKDARWVQDIIHAAIEEQFKSSVQTGAQGMKKIIDAHRPKKTMFAPKCGQSASPGEAEPSRDEPAERKIKKQRAPTAPARSASASADAAAPQDKPAATHQVSRQSSVKSAAAGGDAGAAGKPARHAHHYPAPERDLRHCLGLATSADIIACANK